MFQFCLLNTSAQPNILQAFNSDRNSHPGLGSQIINLPTVARRFVDIKYFNIHCTSSFEL